MNQRVTLGQCPKCTASIPQSGMLIEYEKDGRPAMFAECPSCHDVVNPEPIHHRRDLNDAYPGEKHRK